MEEFTESWYNLLLENQNGRSSRKRQNRIHRCSRKRFCKKYSLSTTQAFNYLDRFNAIDFVNQHYNITHTLSFAEIIDDLSLYCKNHGGNLWCFYIMVQTLVNKGLCHEWCWISDWMYHKRPCHISRKGFFFYSGTGLACRV